MNGFYAPTRREGRESLLRVPAVASSQMPTRAFLGRITIWSSAASAASPLQRRVRRPRCYLGPAASPLRPRANVGARSRKARREHLERLRIGFAIVKDAANIRKEGLRAGNAGPRGNIQVELCALKRRDRKAKLLHVLRSDDVLLLNEKRLGPRHNDGYRERRGISACVEECRVYTPWVRLTNGYSAGIGRAQIDAAGDGDRVRWEEGGKDW